MPNKKSVILVGAGGHAKVVAEMLSQNGYKISAYVDSQTAEWVDAPKINEKDLSTFLEKEKNYAIGIGGQTLEALDKRYQLYLKYLEHGFCPPLVHTHAIISSTAHLEQGVQVCAGAIIQASARIKQGVIVNTRAVIEHDCIIGEGSHIAPGAIVLGGAKIGNRCMVGAGSVILPNSVIPDETLIKATTLVKNCSK